MTPAAGAQAPKLHRMERARPLRAARAIAAEVTPGSGPGRPRDALRRAVPGLLVLAAALAALAVLRSRDLADAFVRAVHADWRWALAGAVFEAASLAGYMTLLHRVVASASPRLRWRDSYDITLGGAAATRLLPTAGLGGVAVLVWALRAHGIARRELSERLIAFMLLIYTVYLGALLICGVAIATGLASVPRDSGLGVIGALVAAGAVLVIVAVAQAPVHLARILGRVGARGGRAGAVCAAAAGVLPAAQAGIGRAAGVLRRPRPALFGAVIWWACDIGVLAAMLHAFGASPSAVVLVFAYFIGTLFNLIPLPGSLSGGLAGALIALGVAPGAAIGGVLAYRAIAIWLPAAAGLASLVSLRASVARWRGHGQRSADTLDAVAAVSLSGEVTA